MSARYEISEGELDVLAITGPEGTRYIDGEEIEARVIRQQSADIASLRAELAAALDLLDTIFAAYEDGVPCYQDPDEIIGYLGNAVLLDDDTFRRAASLLNQSKPRKDGE